mmetsp:Transcript_50919/g.94880  ORF Transcript_50919/g.94880 Transcript_50919/m.94880 type:complete len:575 (-) Transcript_50919:610-2334(-)
MECENMVPASAPLTLEIKTKNFASPSCSPSKRPFGVHNRCGMGSAMPSSPCHNETKRNHLSEQNIVNASSEELEGATVQELDQSEINPQEDTLEELSKRGSEDGDAELEELARLACEEREINHNNWPEPENLSVNEKLLLAEYRVGQLTELLDVLQDGEHQWVDEQRALMSALDTTQVELWQTCSALASAKKKIRSLQQSTHGNPTSQAEGAQGQDQDTETEQADKFDIDDEYEDEVAKDPRVVSMMDYVGALEEEVMLERQAHAATEARLHYQGAQLDLVTHKLGKLEMRHAYETASQRQDVHCPENEDEDEPQVQMSQGQLMYLLSEQQDAREQNYTLTRERSELIAELVRTRQHAEDLRVWASLKADDGEEKTGAGEATVGGLSQTSDLKWQLHLARGLCSQMHMACSEAVHEKEAIQAQCLEALQERDAYVAHASALHDHTEYLQRKLVEEMELNQMQQEDHTPEEEMSLHGPSTSPCAVEYVADPPVDPDETETTHEEAVPECIQEFEGPPASDAQEEVEQVLIYNEMLKGQVGELLETLESQESQNDMLLCEVESQQKQMKSMIDVRT